MRTVGRYGAAVAAIAVAAAPGRALAHANASLEPHDIAGAWTLDPWIVVPMVLTLYLYLRGLFVLWQAAGRGHGIRHWEAASFIAGMALLVLALVSPLDAMGEVLFSAHMVQHEVMMLGSAPLLILGRPGVALLWGLPVRWRARAASISRLPETRGIWRGLTTPVIAWLLHAVALWIWHHPGFFQATLEDDGVHALQHISFLGTALVFTWTVIHPRAANIGTLGSVVYLFTTAVHTGVLGALLTFARSPWYEGYLATTGAWGLTPLEDQQLGGLIMWVPAGVVYLFAALVVLARHISDSDTPSNVDRRNGVPTIPMN